MSQQEFEKQKTNSRTRTERYNKSHPNYKHDQPNIPQYTNSARKHNNQFRKKTIKA